MGITDFFADLYSSVVTQDVVAEAPKADTGDEHQSGKDHGQAGTAEQRGASVRGGASNTTPATAVAKESPEEAEVNKADVKKQQESDKSADDEEQPEEEAEEEEEEEEEEEPEDLKPKIEEGE